MTSWSANTTLFSNCKSHSGGTIGCVIRSSKRTLERKGASVKVRWSVQNLIHFLNCRFARRRLIYYASLAAPCWVRFFLPCYPHCARSLQMTCSCTCYFWWRQRLDLCPIRLAANGLSLLPCFIVVFNVPLCSIMAFYHVRISHKYLAANIFFPGKMERSINAVCSLKSGCWKNLLFDIFCTPRHWCKNIVF